MLRYALFGALALVCLTSNAFSAACAPVATAEQVMSDVAKQTGADFVPLSDDDAQKIVTAWNAIPPVSNQVAQQVFLILSPHAEGAIIAFVDKGEVCGWQHMPNNEMANLLRLAFGVKKQDSDKKDDHVTPWDSAI